MSDVETWAETSVPYAPSVVELFRDRDAIGHATSISPTPHCARRENQCGGWAEGATIGERRIRNE
jgi:hypothetical protein